ALESPKRLGHTLHANLEMVEGLTGDIRSPERALFGVPVQFHPLAGTPVSEQHVLAFVVPAPVDFLQIEHFRIELDRPLEVRDPNADIADPQIGHGSYKTNRNKNPSRALAVPIDCAGKSRDRSYASCLTAKPPMHHRRVLVWLWRLVAAG